MFKLFDRVKVNIATTGDEDIVFGAASSNAFLTPAEAGATDGDTVRYVLVDGTDFEIGIGTIYGSVSTMNRTTVTRSKIGGTVGTSKINLSGTAVLAIPGSAADILVPVNNLADLDDADEALDNLGGTTVGKALLTAANAGAALDNLGGTTVGKALLTAADEAAALAALPSAYHKANILGTVSQSGGVPTGAILERGNNANGEYVRFANGLQICTKKDSVPSGTGANFGWTFPATFPGGEPYVAMNMAIGSGSDAKNFNAQMQYQGISSSAAILTYTTSSTVTGHLIAIGRWF